MTKPDKNGWLPIETAPKDGTEILVALNQTVSVMWWTKQFDTETGKPGWIDGVQDGLGYYYTYKPTHWQPLPKLPVTP